MRRAHCTADSGTEPSWRRRFARLAFIQAYRERTNNPAAAAQASTSASAAPTPAPAPVPPPLPTSSSGVTLRLAGPTASSVSTPGGAGSPPSTVPRPKKKITIANSGQTESDGTPGPSVPAPPYPTKLSKKMQAAATKIGIAFDVNDPALPQNQAERDRILTERYRMIQAFAKKEAKAKAKEKKKLEMVGEQARAGTPQYAADLQVGTPGVAAPTPAARFVYNGGM